MTMQPLGPPIRSYEDLHACLRARAEALNISRLTIDEATGLPAGYASKLLAPKPTKKIGSLSMALMLQALGLKLVAYEDEQALKKIRPLLEPRVGKVSVRAVPWGRSGKQGVVSLRWVKRIARKGGHARAEKLAARRRSAVASKAAHARWRAHAMNGHSRKMSATRSKV